VPRPAVEPGACRELGASNLDPGAAVSGVRPERDSSSEGESGVNLGDGGPDSGTVLPLPLPEEVAFAESSSALR
jgi:hypothetical protein